MTDEGKIEMIAAMAAIKMKETGIPVSSAMAYNMAEGITKEFKKKGAKLPPGFTAGLTVKIKALLK